MFRKKKFEEKPLEVIHEPVICDLSIYDDLRIMYHRSGEKTNGDYKYSIELLKKGEWVVYARRDNPNNAVAQYSYFFFELHPDKKPKEKTNDTHTD